MAMQKTALQTGPVERLATGFTFVEGPVWHRDGHWYFSDIPESRIHTVTPSGEVGVHRDPSGQSNGLTLDGAGRLLACEHGNRRVSAADGSDSISVLADAFEGKRLNSPNDLVTHSSGAI